MTDIFISYCREDQATARRYADALAREGFSVWWDQTINVGEEFDAVTESALEDARAVVVLWSKQSVNSRWVRAEATQAQANRSLVPVMIEDCKRPIMFELTHTADLVGWSGDTTEPRWRTFADGLRRFIGKATGSSAGAPIAPTAPHRPQRAPRRLAAWAGVAAGLLAVAAGVYWFLNERGTGVQGIASPDKSIAVLPFRSFSADAEQEYFADGLTEEILNALARVADLKVTARTSSFAFKDKAEDLKAVGKALGVAHVLEGSVRRSGDQLRITAQLIGTDTGFHLWSKTYDRPARDIFAVQDDIARSVAGALQVTLGVGVGEQPGMTRNIEAYEAWLAARGVTYTGLQSMRQHIQLLQRAVELDPDFAQPWWDLSAAYSSALSGTPADAAERQQKADAAFAEYRRLLPDSPRIHERLAEDAIEAGQLIAAAKHYEAAAEAARKLSSGKPEPLYILGQGKTPIGFPDIVGRPRESVALFEQAKARDPLNEVVSLWLAYLYGTVGDFPAAFAEFERSASLGTDARRIGLALGIAMATRDRQQLLRWLDVAIAAEQKTGGDFYSRLKTLLDKPEAALAFLRARVSKHPASAAYRAHWFAWFGDYDTALEALRSGLEPGARYALLWAMWDPGLAEVRKLPGFKQLVRDAGLVDYWRKYGWGDYCKPIEGSDDFQCQ